MSCVQLSFFFDLNMPKEFTEFIVSINFNTVKLVCVVCFFAQLGSLIALLERVGIE